MVNAINLGLEIAGLLFMIITLFADGTKVHRTQSSHLIRAAMWVGAALMSVDVLGIGLTMLTGDPVFSNVAISLDYCLAYAFGCLFHLYFLQYLEERELYKAGKLHRLLYVPFVPTTVIPAIVNLWTGCLWTTSLTPWGWNSALFVIAQLGVTVIIAVNFYTICSVRSGMRPGERFILYLYGVLMVLGLAMDYLFSLAMSYLMVAALCALAYLNFTIAQEMELADREKKLNETRLNAMQLQMNPHFIYNTLGSIAALCDLDPQQAAHYIDVFSSYLRTNFGEMSNRSMVSFSQEVEHLKLYLEIEQLRFPDLEVITDFRATDFELPRLSVQPLVENAIKHGLRPKRGDGLLTISSYETFWAYVVRVEDNGVGFTQVPQDGRSHIGLENVKNRLELFHCGELKLNSTPGEGTVAEIRIWKHQQTARPEEPE